MAYANKNDLYKNQILRWREVKEKAVAFMGGKCAECGYDKHPAALQFHHKNPEEKDASWNKIRLRAWHKIINELQKCVMLCANCHSILHAVSKYD